MTWLWLVGTFIVATALYVFLMRKVWPTDPQKASWLAAGIVFASTIHRVITEPNAEWTQRMVVISMIVAVVLVGRFVGVRRAGRQSSGR